MKIEEITKISRGVQTADIIKDKPFVGNTGIMFQRHMSDLGDSRQQKYIEDLQARIFAQGEILKKKVDIYEFAQYRKLISELIGEVAGNAYTCTRTDGFGKSGKHKVYILIKKVNSRLDEMAQEILKQQEANIKLLKMVDDVRGLLLDIFL